jgi:hypothetical protein
MSDGPEGPPEEYRYVLVEGAPDGINEAGLQCWEVCDREAHRVERVAIDGEPFWSCVDCDLVESAAGGQKTLDGGVRYE